MSAITERIAAVRPYWDAYWAGRLPMLCAALPKDPANPVRKPPIGITDAAAAQLLEVHAALYDFSVYGSICRHGMYTAGRVGVPQCDFGYMIGPRHFQSFALPYLQREFGRLDGVCYHLDGVGNLPNLEPLCADPRLHLIQWVPGAGHGRDDWSWLHDKIDALGKGQILQGSVHDFERWRAAHTAPWLYWVLAGSTADEITGCLRSLGV